MKKFHFLFILCGIVFCSMNVNAQLFEVKINPLGALFQTPDVSVEYIVSENFGIEGKIGYSWDKVDLASIGGPEVNIRGFDLAAIGKYYFNPEDGADRFYAGLYGRFSTDSSQGQSLVGISDYSRTRFSLGLIGGFKWVGDNNIVLDINLGLGRALINKVTFEDGTIPINEQLFALADLTGISTIALGYRFGGK